MIYIAQRVQGHALDSLAAAEPVSGRTWKWGRRCRSSLKHKQDSVTDMNLEPTPVLPICPLVATGDHCKSKPSESRKPEAVRHSVFTSVSYDAQAVV